MKLFALSDLHIGHQKNRTALQSISNHADDWLILAGDLGERLDHLRWCFELFGARFAQLIWVPGNHELYTTPRDPCQLKGEARYARLVALCREHGVLTPEDPWPLWPGEGAPTRIAPLFIGYDYSFGPPGTPASVIAWAAEGGIRATDERYLDPSPHPSREAWCAARLALTRKRLDTEVADGERLVLINHYPLRRDLVRLFRIPRFVPWCGTRHTEQWHVEYPVDVVVSGHLHMRATDWRDGVRFEEVALGYPRHWRQERGPDAYLRQILPHPPGPHPREGGPTWHR